MTISTGKLVSLDYTLKNDDQEVIDASAAGQPFVYVHGQHQIVTGLESALEGKQVGDALSVVVEPEQGYGLRDEDALLELPLDQLPEDARKVGSRLQGQAEDGRPVLTVVHELKDDTAILDFNHPLAGMTLHFDVKVLSVGDPPVSAE